MKSLVDKFVQLRAELRSALVDRDDAIDCVLLALLSGEHCAFLGEPGVAKSFLIRELCRRISGADYFEKLLTKFTTPEEVFGPLSLSALEKDQFIRVKDGTALEAQLIFLDECWKGNSAILNSLLTLINERVYHEGGKSLKVPLLSLFGASNETPEDDSLNALYDRFLLRVLIHSVATEDDFRAVLRLEKVGVVTPVLSLDDLKEAINQVSSIPLSDAGLEAIVAVKQTAAVEGLACSDRRWKQSVGLLKAAAWLNGEASAEAHHVDVLRHVLWSEPKEIAAAERAVMKVASPVNLEAIEMEDAARELYDKRPRGLTDDALSLLEPLLKQLVQIRETLQERIESGNGHAPLDRAHQALNRINGWHGELATIALQSLGGLRQAPGNS